IFMDPSLGLSQGHHAVVAENYARLALEAGRTAYFVGNRRGPKGTSNFTGLFDYALEDVFRATLYDAPLLGNRHLVRVARRVLALRADIRRTFARGEITTHVPFASKASRSPRPPRDHAACNNLVAPFKAMRTLDEVWRRLAPRTDD